MLLQEGLQSSSVPRKNSDVVSACLSGVETAIRDLVAVVWL